MPSPFARHGAAVLETVPRSTPCTFLAFGSVSLVGHPLARPCADYIAVRGNGSVGVCFWFRGGACRRKRSGGHPLDHLLDHSARRISQPAGRLARLSSVPCWKARGRLGPGLACSD